VILLRAWRDDANESLTVRIVSPSDGAADDSVVLVSRSIDEVCTHIRNWLRTVQVGATP
jgi:hypothetical protein